VTWFAFTNRLDDLSTKLRRQRPHSALNDQTPSEFAKSFDLPRAVEKAGF